MNNRSDIVSRTSNVNVRSNDIKNGIKNPWRWEWLDKNVNGIYLQECIRKLVQPGVAFCILCSKELYYKSRGSVALVDHVKSAKHLTALELRKNNFSLPETGECSSNNKGNVSSPYGLHPMYTVFSPTVEANVPQPLVPISDRVANSEAMLLSFIAEKSLPFSIAPDILNLAKELAKDQRSLDRISIHRTSASYKLRLGVAQTFKDKMFYILKNTFFSLNIDETTSNNHKKIVTVLVNYLENEKIVTKHLESFSLNSATSDAIFDGIKNCFQANAIPWENLMSVLLDSCNVMRGKKSGLETKIAAYCPHLLDIDGDSCHHAHNAAKAFCKPFAKYVESLIADIHNDLKWSPDLRSILSHMCEVLNVKYTMPQNFIAIRWLSVYDAAHDLSRLFNALVLFYHPFLSSSKRTEFFHMVVKILKQQNISEEGKNTVKDLQSSLQKKVMTEAGKNRKTRIVTKLFETQLETKLNVSLFLSVLPLLQEYIKLFQSEAPMIHLLYEKQIALLKNVMGCFLKPEVISLAKSSAKKMKQLCVDDVKNHLQKKFIFVGDSVKKLISLSPKSSLGVIKRFYQNTLKAYIGCTKVLQTKMPITNRLLKLVSSIDPKFKGHSLTLQLMKELPDLVRNVLKPDERDQFDLEVQKYHSDPGPEPNEVDVAGFWISVEKSQKYPQLAKMALALLTCFHGPKVESSFSAMNNIITPKSSRLNIPTFSALQSVRYELSAKKTSSVAHFRRQDILKDPVDRNLCTNLRSSYKRYKDEKMNNKSTKEERKRQLNIKNQKVLTKIAAKRICAKAAKKQRKTHRKQILKKSNEASGSQSTKVNHPENSASKKEATVSQSKHETVVVIAKSKDGSSGPPSKKRKTNFKDKNQPSIKDLFAKCRNK